MTKRKVKLLFVVIDVEQFWIHGSGTQSFCNYSPYWRALHSKFKDQIKSPENYINKQTEKIQNVVSVQ